MYFSEAVPNAIDSTVKGSFKDDDGSYSDKVGKIVGGLNPAGDVRDIIADGKNVIDGKKGSGIALGASIIGSIPGGGDVAKPIIKEVGEELTEKGFKEVGTEATEKLAKAEIEQIIKQTGKLIIEDGRTLSASEKEFADKMAAEGKTIKARVESTVSGEKNPDFEIDGEVVEFKYVSNLKGTTADKLSARLSGRILDGGSQATRVSLNVTDQAGMTEEIVKRAIGRAFGKQTQMLRLGEISKPKLQEVRIYGKDFDFTISYKMD